MKFWAKVKFKGGKNAAEVIRAFFQDFHSESSIVIRGNDAMVEVFFEEDRPMRLIEAIGNCEVIEFKFGKDLEDVENPTTPIKREVQEEKVEQQEESKSENEPEEEEVNCNQLVKEECNSTSEESEEVLPVKVPVKKPTRKKGRKSSKNSENPNIPYIEELAQKARSFDQFVNMLASWLELGKRQEFFEKLAMVATTIPNVSWKELEQALKEKTVYYSQYDRIWTVRHISEQLSEYDVTIIPLLEMIVQYKHQFFEKKDVEEDSTKGPVKDSDENAEADSTSEPKASRMKCMPEIPEFEKVLNELDKTRPVEDRLKEVLTVMGWKKMNLNEQDEIFEFAIAAMKIQNMTFENIFKKAGFIVETVTKERMTLSTFINAYVQQYAPNMKVKVLDFLKELQPFVMLESEIDSLDNFNEETL